MRLTLVHLNRTVFEKDLGKIQYENCDCPYEYEEFLSEYNCPAKFSQLEEDFKRFPQINLEELFLEGKRKRWRTEATVHFVIRNQKLYVKRLGSITDFKMFVEGILFSLLRKVKLPDVEFIFNGEFSKSFNV